jgi:hypothetical protein
MRELPIPLEPADRRAVREACRSPGSRVLATATGKPLDPDDLVSLGVEPGALLDGLPDEIGNGGEAGSPRIRAGSATHAPRAPHTMETTSNGSM